MTVRYGGVVANDGVNLAIDRGEVVGLIGPNGAGKTSLVDAVTGFTAADGEVVLDGRRLDRLPPHRRRRAGLARTWQAGELFADLTVADNVAVAVQRRGWAGLVADVLGRSARTAPDPSLEMLGLLDDADRRPDELSLGRQRLVGVARALAGGSSVVLLDEPAAGLDTDESEAFGDVVRTMATSGRGVLLIDHDMNLVLNVCDRVYVLDFGRVIACGTPTEIRADAAVVAAYLGEEPVA
ncbi:ABC transporter ATP-binding protein [Mumia zhuanghuii]|uniref:ABC transporter ATP-binding protein n=1 Tax=Mumia zhuanghuii TaxID=2585211 RepID=A0A5Q6RYK6_9ACTN|nr:ABC transporter ATP-binding protein [Mumia zhuanghuii]